MSDSVSPLAPASFPTLPPVAGVTLSSFPAGLRYTGRDDLMLAVMPEGTTVAGVFTSSLCPSSTVDWCRANLAQGFARAVLCNAGNANAFTGSAGTTTVERSGQALSELLGCRPDQIFLAATGVIGEPMPDDALVGALTPVVEGLAPSTSETWQAAANAIRTTDTFAKGSSASVAGTSSHVVGYAKGSGMIAPDMATMLGFVFTDLAVSAPVLQAALSQSVPGSYNRVTVDSDTSTSDTVLLFATGAAGEPPMTSTEDERFGAFVDALNEVNLDLAHQICRDGEGATKFITIQVNGADSDAAATIVARSIADSPLVKTALGAEDANWGRIVMAVGKAGQKADRDTLDIFIGPEQITANGKLHPDYVEDRATEHLQQDEVEVRVEMNIGSGSGTIWTCDLTHGYIDINASYRS